MVSSENLFFFDIPRQYLLPLGLDGLNVSLDNAFTEVKKEDAEVSEWWTPPYRNPG